MTVYMKVQEQALPSFGLPTKAKSLLYNKQIPSMLHRLLPGTALLIPRHTTVLTELVDQSHLSILARQLRADADPPPPSLQELPDEILSRSDLRCY